METVMSLVLEESEEVNPDLISLLLDCVKKDNQDILHCCQRIGEKKCLVLVFAKLKPRLRNLGIYEAFSNDYYEIVATICQETHDADGNSSGEHVCRIALIYEQNMMPFFLFYFLFNLDTLFKLHLIISLLGDFAKYVAFGSFFRLGAEGCLWSK
ncbi:hypothetical protein Syun_021339 [Stephania yunnanensis]|uniref:Uncharacterized protein n=1 Tax=Stephania yunnanensis TaxID=152371 RepID=A0AAP0IHF3_9MAGN